MRLVAIPETIDSYIEVDMTVVIYYIGSHKKVKNCKSVEEAETFIIYLRNMWGIDGRTIEEYVNGGACINCGSTKDHSICGGNE